MVPTPATSPEEEDPPPRVSAVTWLGVAAVLVAVVGAARVVHRLEAEESLTTVAAPVAAAWSLTSDGRHTLALPGARAVVSRGVVRVRACAATAPRDLTLLVNDLSTGHAAIATERLTARSSSSQRCAEVVWTAPAARRVRLALATRAQPSSPLTEVTVRVSAPIRLAEFWPAALFVLGLALALLGAPRRVAAPAQRSPTALPAVMGGAMGFIASLVALFVVNAAAQLPVARWGMRGATFFASTLLQQLLLAGFAAVALGAVGARDRRAALELDEPPSGWAPRAFAVAAALLALATLVGTQLHDAADSPMGRLIEAMPMRYVVAFGAVCAPLPEELYFRALLGRVCEGLTGRRDAAAAIVAPAIVFTLMHAMQLQGALLGLVPIAAVALANGWLRWRTGSIVAPWAVHTLYNAALTLSVLA